MLMPGIYYPASLTKKIIDNANNSRIVQEQLKNPDINVFTGKRFDDKSEDDSFNMKSLIDVGTNAIKSAFNIDQPKVNVDFGNLNNVLTQNSLPSLNIEDILKNIKFSISSKDLSNLMNDILEGYQKYIQKNPEADIKQISKQLSEYLQSKEASEIINKKIQECKDAEKYKLYGELITSNLYRIDNYNKDSIILENFG